MNKLDKVSRDSKLLVDATKDTIVNNILNAVREGVLPLNQEQASALLNLVSISSEEAFQKSLPTFQRMIKTVL